MIRLCCLCVALALVGATAAPAAAQEKSAPQVVTMTTNADELYRDIRYAMGLGTAEEAGRWEDLKKYLDVFLIGLDRTKPARMDVIYGGETRRYRTSLPVEDLRKFRDENLDTLGITSQRKTSRTYKLSDAFEGWMRYFPQTDYASIAQFDDDVPSEYTPLQGIQHLLERRYEAAVEGTNVPEGIDKRRRMYQRDREEWMAALQKDKDETADDFALRRLLYEHQLDETERIFAEGKHLLLGGTVDAQKGNIRFDLELTPLAETSLARNLEAIGQAPSRFAGVPKIKDPIISGRITLPLDEMRQENLFELTKLLRTRYKNIADGRQSTAAEKEASHKAIDLFFDMVDTGTKSGLLDGFMEGHAAAGGKNTVVGGLKTTDGEAFIDILKLLPDVGKDHRVELDVAEAGGVKIHRATWPLEFRNDLRDFFGDDMYYVGTAKETIWFGAGPGALDELKAAIADAEQPGDGKAQPFVDVLMRLGPWTELLHKWRGDVGRVEMRERAIEAFRPGDDQFGLVLDKTDGHVAGQMFGNTGILRFVGKMFAEFTRNIDEQ